MAHVVGMNPILSRGGRLGPATSRDIPRRSLRALRPSVSVEPLVEIVESAILPRLLAAHGVSPHFPDNAIDIGRGVDHDVEPLVGLAMNVEAGALLGHVESLLMEGMSIDSLFVDLLAPAARQLGVRWEEDRCDFIEVTMGLWRLQEIVRELAARWPPEGRRCASGQRALFAAMPGDQHSFGTAMIDETFRREGWKTSVALDPTTPELIEHVARDWFDVVGLTVSCDCHIGPLPSLIHAIRSVSRNSHIVVMVGGRVFVEDPTLALEVGADGTAADAVQAVGVAAAGLVGAVAREMAASG